MVQSPTGEEQMSNMISREKVSVDSTLEEPCWLACSLRKQTKGEKCLPSETGELLKRLLLQNTKGNVQSSLSQRTNRIFCWYRDFFLSVCLMDWNTLG